MHRAAMVRTKAPHDSRQSVAGLCAISGATPSSTFWQSCRLHQMSSALTNTLPSTPSSLSFPPLLSPKSPHVAQHRARSCRHSPALRTAPHTGGPRAANGRTRPSPQRREQRRRRAGAAQRPCENARDPRLHSAGSSISRHLVGADGDMTWSPCAPAKNQPKNVYHHHDIHSIHRGWMIVRSYHISRFSVFCSCPIVFPSRGLARGRRSAHNRAGSAARPAWAAPSSQPEPR